MKKRKIVCFGPGPAFKGGIANYNTSLAKAFDKIDGIETYIVSWTQQYPSIVPREFKDEISKTNFLENTKIKIKYITNYNKPSTWKTEKVTFLNSFLIVFFPHQLCRKTGKFHTLAKSLFWIEI